MPDLTRERAKHTQIYVFQSFNVHKNMCTLSRIKYMQLRVHAHRYIQCDQIGLSRCNAEYIENPRKTATFRGFLRI